MDKILWQTLGAFDLLHSSRVNTYNIVVWETQHNKCRLGLFLDSDFSRDLEGSKSTSGGVLRIFGSHTFVPISWMCKKQTSVSHTSSKAEIISLDAGLRMDGIPALTHWDLVIEVIYSAPNKIGQPQGRAPGKPIAGYQAKHAQPHPIQAHQRHSNKHCYCDKLQRCGAAFDKAWDKVKNLPAWRESRVKRRRSWFMVQSHKEGKTVHL